MRIYRRPFVQGGLGLTCILAATFAAGQEESKSGTRATPGHPIAFNIPDESLSHALKDFAAQSRLQVVYQTGDLDSARPSPALRGTYTPQLALERLLLDTHLHYTFLNETTVSITSANSAKTSEATAFRLANSGPATASDTSGSQPPPEENTESPSNFTPNAEQRDVQQVVITGSRLAQSARDSPQPVQIYSKQEIQDTGRTTVSDFLSSLPGVSTAMPESVFQSNVGGTTVRLHGLPIGTTLVLINGRRVESSPAQKSFGVFFDLNNIPLAAVDRIEVVSAGSSAVYGSDAIAGVVNIVLTKSFDGLEADASYGGAPGTDESNVSLLMGKKIDNGGISLVGSFQSRGALQGDERSSVARGADPQNAGIPNYSELTRYTCNPGNVYFPKGYSYNGAPPVRYAAVPKGYTGIPTASEFANTFGTLNSCSNDNYLGYATLVPESQRAGMFASGYYEFNPSVEVFTELAYSHVHQVSTYSPAINLLGSPGSAYYTVAASNPYNPFGVPVKVSAYLPAAGVVTQQIRTDFVRPLAGIRGHFADNWSWESAIWNSENTTHYTALNPGNFAALSAALSSSNPATALNPFTDGAGGTSQLLASIAGPPTLHEYKGRLTGGNGFIRGPVIDLPSGSLEMVIGGEYLNESVQTDGVQFERKSYAGFGEARIPVVTNHDANGAQDILAANLAIRYDHYSDFGGKSTPQFGLLFQPTTSLSVRGTYSRAFKAPSLYALYATTNVTEGFLFDPKHGNAGVPATLIQGGNPYLRPEIARSHSVSLNYLSDTVQGLEASITHWAIKERDSIQTLSPNVILANESSFPSLVIRDSNGTLKSVRAGYANFGSIDVRGLDYSILYRTESGIVHMIPSITATQTYHYITALVPGSPPTNAAGIAQDSGNFSPVWKAVADIKFGVDSFKADLTARYVGPYSDYDTSRRIGNFALFDINAEYVGGAQFRHGHDWIEGSTLTVGAINVLNRLPQNSNYQYGLLGYDPTQADIRGRFVYVRMGVKW